jgi:hypothetical protein
MALINAIEELLNSTERHELLNALVKLRRREVAVDAFWELWGGLTGSEKGHLEPLIQLIRTYIEYRDAQAEPQPFGFRPLEPRLKARSRGIVDGVIARISRCLSSSAMVPANDAHGVGSELAGGPNGT